jgi:hypothetical protein
MLKISRLTIAASLGFVASGAMGANVAIDVTNANNGLYDIYSATFDGALIPCSGSSPSYCSFFGGDPGPTRAISQSPDPSGVVNGVPGGIGPSGTPVAPVPAAGSFLDLTLSGGNTSLALGAGSSIRFGNVTLIVPGQLNATAVGAGMVFNTGGSTSVNANGEAEFLVSTSPAIAVDFSRFSQVVTSCTGAACPLVALDILNLDIVRYRLFIDYDPSFTSFTGNFIGQTANNSLVFAQLDSAVVPVPAAVWLLGSALGGLAALRRRAKAAA